VVSKNATIVVIQSDARGRRIMEVLEFSTEWAQITDWSGTLACMSFFLQRNRRNVTQQDLIHTCADHCSGTYAASGGIDANTAHLLDIQTLATHHQFQAELAGGDGIPDIIADEAYLVLTKVPTNHCLLYFRTQTDGRRLLMNPGGRAQVLDQNGDPITDNGAPRAFRVGLIEVRTDQEVIAMGCHFVKLSST
jgi:hypothetical protein